MMICTFFGHRDTPHGVEPRIKEILTELIEKNGVRTFYVGNQGKFDLIVLKVLKELSLRYKIKYYVVLAYMPKQKTEYDENTLLPDGIEKAPPRFAISYRNKWMIEKSDYVVTYVSREFGGAAKFKSLAEKKGKTVINTKI